MTKVFRWCSLNLENFWFIFGLWFYDLISQHKWPYVTSYSCPWIKYLTGKNIICSKMLRKICIYVKRKSNISFRVIKNSSFDQRFLMVKTFLKILWWRFLVPHSEHLLVSSVTLSCVMQNILTLSMLVYYNANSFYSMFLSNNQGFKWNSFWGFIVFKLLLNFITSQYS